MATLTAIHRNSDETISFQLYKADGTVEDVDDILDITVTLVHKISLVIIETYEIGDITLDDTDNTIYIFMEGSVTDGKQTGIYKLHVEWSVVNLYFPDGTEDSIDDQDAFRLIA